LERWRNSTFKEFNYAVAGYWRRWEWQAGWMTREIVWQLIMGNPNIENKPTSINELYDLSFDKIIISKRKEEVKISPEELESIRQRMLKRINEKNGTS
jgi:hypothetical protein